MMALETVRVDLADGVIDFSDLKAIKKKEKVNEKLRVQSRVTCASGEPREEADRAAEPAEDEGGDATGSVQESVSTIQAQQQIAREAVWKAYEKRQPEPRKLHWKSADGRWSSWLLLDIKRSAGGFLAYFMAWDLLTTIAVLAVATFTIAYEGYTRHEWIFWKVWELARMVQALLSLPFLVFALPFARQLLTNAVPTGYDKAGVLCPKLVGSQIRRCRDDNGDCTPEELKRLRDNYISARQLLEKEYQEAVLEVRNSRRDGQPLPAEEEAELLASVEAEYKEKVDEVLRHEKKTMAIKRREFGSMAQPADNRLAAGLLGAFGIKRNPAEALNDSSQALKAGAAQGVVRLRLSWHPAQAIKRRATSSSPDPATSLPSALASPPYRGQESAARPDSVGQLHVRLRRTGGGGDSDAADRNISELLQLLECRGVGDPQLNVSVGSQTSGSHRATKRLGFAPTADGSHAAYLHDGPVGDTRLLSSVRLLPARLDTGGSGSGGSFVFTGTLADFSDVYIEAQLQVASSECCAVSTK